LLAHVQQRHEQTLNSADGILWFGCLAFAATGSGMAIILGNVQQRSEKVFVVSMARPSGSSPTHRCMVAWSIAVVYIASVAY